MTYKVYSKSNCASCIEAKQLLTNHNYEFEELLLGVHFNIIELYEVAPRHHKSFPMISKMVGDSEEYVGGLKELIVDIEKRGL